MLGYGQTPVLQRLCPFFLNILGSQADRFQKGYIGGKGPFGLGHLPDLAMESFDNIGLVDQLADTT